MGNVGKHTSSGQTSSHIAGTEVFHATAGRSIEEKGVNRGLDVLTCPQGGKVKVSGGAYGKSRLM
jgi:hypothetical protein